MPGALKGAGFMLVILSACGLATLHMASASPDAFNAGGIIGSLVADLTVPVE